MVSPPGASEANPSYPLELTGFPKFSGLVQVSPSRFDIHKSVLPIPPFLLEVIIRWFWSYVIKQPPSRNSEFTFEVPSDAEQYLLSADELVTKTVKLNGKILELNADDSLPEIIGKEINNREVTVPAQSMMFMTFNDIK